MGTKINLTAAESIIVKHLKEMCRLLKESYADRQFECVKKKDQSYIGLSYELFEISKNNIAERKTEILSLFAKQESDTNRNIVLANIDSKYETFIRARAKDLANELGMPIALQAKIIRLRIPCQTRSRATRDDASQREVDNLKSQLVVADSESTTLRQEVENLRTQNSELQEMISKLRAELDSLQQFKKDYDAAMAVLNDPIKNQINPPQ